MRALALPTEQAERLHGRAVGAAETVAGLLGCGDRDVVVAVAPERSMTGGGGQAVTVHDAVLRAVRRR